MLLAKDPLGAFVGGYSLPYTLMLFVVLFLPVAGALDDFTITLRPGQSPSFTGYGVAAVMARETPGEVVEWNLTTAKSFLVGSILSEGYFSVDRARQVVPEVDDHFFYEDSPANVVSGEGAAWLVNLTKTGTQVRIALSFPVEAVAQLRLTRDLVAPTFSVGTPQNITHYSFYLETTTNEYALATLTYWVDPGGELIPLPTTIPALLQRFPAQGLRENSTYAYQVKFEDWAKNAATSGTDRLQTQLRPLVAGPVVTALVPADGARLDMAPEAIEANFTTPIGVIDPALHIRLFVDKHEVTEYTTKTSTSIRYAPSSPFGERFHSVGLELLNSESGKTVATWDFTVGSVEPTPAPPAWVTLLVLFGLFFLRRRRTNE